MTLTNEEIVELLDEFDKGSKAIKKNILTSCWYMRGSIQLDDAMLLSPDDRTMINDIIKDNMEVTKTSGLPFF